MRRAGAVVAVTMVVVGAFAVFEPSVLNSTVRSPRAIALLVLVVVGTSLMGRIVARRWGRGAGRLTAVMMVGLAAWLLVAPAIRQTTLDEAFPVAGTGSTAPTATVSTSADQVTTTTPGGATEPRRLTIGRLEGIGHDASGSVSVFSLPDGSAVVRFEEVDIRGAPDPVLYLVPGPGKQTREGGTRVAALKATKGSFNHAIPASFDLDRSFTVFIWCDRFAVPIANADQQRV